MTATLAPAPPLTRRGGGKRDRIARLERPLLAAGLALVTLHLLDLSLSGPDTAVLGVLAIVAAPLAWLFAQPRVTRPTRLALGVVFGLLATGFGVVSHGLHVVNGAGDLYDVTGIGFILGGLLLVVSGLTAVVARAAPAAPDRARLPCRSRRRLARGRRDRLLPRVHAARDGLHEHACAALGDRRIGARHPPPGGPHRDLRRPRAVGLVRPVDQRRGRARQPRVRRQPGAGDGGDPDAGEARLRRARARQPRQRGERGALERPRRQRPARHRCGAGLPHPPAGRRSRADRRLRLLAGRRGAARGDRARSAAARRHLRRSRTAGRQPRRQRPRVRRAHYRQAHDAGRPRHLGHAAGALAVRVDAADRAATRAADRRRRRPVRDPHQPRVPRRRRGERRAVRRCRTPVTPRAWRSIRRSTSGG